MGWFSRLFGGASKPAVAENREPIAGSSFSCADCGALVHKPKSGCSRCFSAACGACYCSACYLRFVQADNFIKCPRCGGNMGLLHWANPFGL